MDAALIHAIIEIKYKYFSLSLVNGSRNRWLYKNFLSFSLINFLYYLSASFLRPLSANVLICLIADAVSLSRRPPIFYLVYDPVTVIVWFLSGGCLQPRQ